MDEKKVKRHHDREDLAGEHKFGDTGQLILLLIFLIVWIGDSFILEYSTFLNNYIPAFVIIIVSALFLITSGYISWRGLKIVFGEKREKPSVIRKGVFNKVRHPIYLGSILLYLGLTITSCSIFSLIISMFIIAFYYYISKYEEKILLKKYGIDYENYIKEVPMWFPKIF
jgi:protein-S-isoprenylcysteine O-methyltransferase Ste14